jgi:uncharacterized protein
MPTLGDVPAKGAGSTEVPAGPAAASIVQRLLVAIVKAYRYLLSPWLGSQCRFLPTCSQYALDALDLHGAGRGSYLAARRLLRCHPGCAGGWDPVQRPHSPSTDGKPGPRDGLTSPGGTPGLTRTP